ncbi:MAG: integrase core domain-containing protein [Clostridia bacterium]|nr:integrase core domain-containing protein [Clostridia bacterium]
MTMVQWNPFFRPLNKRKFTVLRIYRSFADCKTHIAEYMEFYNSQRPHRTNNYKTPNEKEELFYKKTEPHIV